MEADLREYRATCPPPSRAGENKQRDKRRGKQEGSAVEVLNTPPPSRSTHAWQAEDGCDGTMGPRRAYEDLPFAAADVRLSWQAIIDGGRNSSRSMGASRAA